MASVLNLWTRVASVLDDKTEAHDAKASAVVREGVENMSTVGNLHCRNG